MKTESPSSSPFGVQPSYNMSHNWMGTAFSLLNMRSIMGSDGLSPI
jgi:hypothetical protein